MVTKITLLIFLTLLMGTQEKKTSFYDFTVTNISGHEIPLTDFKGKVILVVNTASLCGFTRQYSDLQELYDTYHNDGLIVLGFPSNNFGNQEPGSDDEIREFCEVNFNITFPLFSRLDVAGPKQDPLFTFLTESHNNDFMGPVNWNFEKFLIDRDGVLQNRFRSSVNPSSSTIQKAIKSLL